MKKIIAAAITFFILIFTTAFAVTGDLDLNSAIYFVKNDDFISFQDTQPEFVGNVAYVPVRAYAEVLGAQVTWDEKTQCVVISLNGKTLSLHVYENAVTVGANITLPFTIYTKNDVTMANYIFIAEYFGYEISYISDTSIVRIKDANATLNDEEIYKKFLQEVQQQREIEREKTVAKPASAEKVAYLTFDDGPGKSTDSILDVLQQYHVKATFFMLEGNMRTYKDALKHIADEGHGLGLHGVTHNKDKIYATDTSVLYEMNITNDTLEEITGKRTLLVRTPYGSKPYLTQKQFKELKSWGYCLWDWNIDSGDSRSNSVTAKMIVTSTLNQLPKWHRPVILFHDKKVTADALPQIIEYLQSNGYEMRAIDADTKPLNFME